MGKGSDVKECNVTHADQRWRDYVRKEDNTKKTWQYKWGFLADHYKEMTVADSLSPSSSAQKVKEPLKLPKLKTPPQDTSRPFPKITSHEIGWRSGRMEIYGRESRPRFSIINQLKWPNDAVP